MSILFLIGNLILGTYATYFCSKDEQGRPVFYDGETANRLCTQCKLNGANEWKYECFPCCYKGQDTTTTDSTSSSNVLISILIPIFVVLTVIVIVAIIVYKKRIARQSRINQNNTTGEAPIPATEETAKRCEWALLRRSNCRTSCSSSLSDSADIAAEVLNPVQEENDGRHHISIAVQEQDDQEESVV